MRKRSEVQKEEGFVWDVDDRGFLRDTSSSAESLKPLGLLSGNATVTLTWGEEKLSVVQYSTVTIGPFAVTVPVDEVPAGMQYLRDLAEKERATKIASFLRALEVAKRQAKE